MRPPVAVSLACRSARTRGHAPAAGRTATEMPAVTRWRRRWATAVTSFALLLALGAPTTALAGSDTIYNGTLRGDAYGPRHSLNSVWVTYYYGSDACVTAHDSGGFLSGVCANGYDTNVGKGLCACVLRQGYAYVAGSYSNGYWRQFW